MKNLVVFFLSALISMPAFSQLVRCSTMEYEQFLKNKNPDYDARRAQIENFTQKYIAKNSGKNTRSGADVITIPVVVHVVYNTAAENISDERVLSQIDALNKDYTRTNSDTSDTPDAFKPVAASLGIQFCLASVDPNGNPTTGIVRTSTSVTSFTVDDKIKYTSQGGDDAWPADQYMNIWVCDLTGGLLGYGQFPGGPDATDGLVVDYFYFGNNPDAFPYGLGRTSSHEFGHCFNLYHIWGDDAGCGGSDLCADTPNQKFETYGCPAFPLTDDCSPSDPGVMFMNYMDYTDDYCMNMFTQDQANRVSALFVPGGYRYSLLSSPGCGLNVFDVKAINIVSPAGNICINSFSPAVTIKNAGLDTLTSVDINYSLDGGAASLYTWTGSLATNESEIVTLPGITTADGDHNLNIDLSNPNGNTDENIFDNSIDISFSVFSVGLTPPLTQSFESTGFPYPGYNISNPDAYYTWERTTMASSLGNASVFMDHYDNDLIGSVDDFTIPPYDVSDLSTATLTFDVAYALYTSDGSYSDTLEVFVSNDCGTTWNQVYKKFQPELPTAPFTLSSFVPADDEWRTETIELTEYAGSEKLQIKFRTISGYENNLYIDNINLSGNVINAIGESNANFKLQFYPNPASAIANISFYVVNAENITMKVINVLGEAVFSDNRAAASGKNNLILPLQNIAAGYYMFELTDGKNSVSLPFVKQ